MAKVVPEQIRTVGDLRTAIEGLADDLPVRAHVGVDVVITEWDVDTNDGLVLFPDDESGMSFVSTAWLHKEHPEMEV